MATRRVIRKREKPKIAPRMKSAKAVPAEMGPGSDSELGSRDNEGDGVELIWTRKLPIAELNGARESASGVGELLMVVMIGEGEGR